MMDEKEIKENIREQIKQYPAILYMKGTPQFPQCGFSSRVVDILKRVGQPFAYINILQEPEIRQHLPQVSNWPTFPQLFINGELVGGCDVIEELDQEGELAGLFDGLVWPDAEEDA
ncbi:MAG: monothiol glutaredoxin, Grx4 family [Gammaproteobacteria bacterium]|nr:MAG: monothiol glutaredoxin, Grx4 family [Gammaproteobacteria bacterium]